VYAVTQLTDLEPRLVFEYFDQLRQIPRCSEHEEAVRSHLVGVARDKGWEAEVDDVGNLLLRVPGSAGHEDKPAVVLQGHLDMVCEKNSDVDFDFATQPIDAYVAGTKVKARGTTLGADNGIGLALALALADDPDAVHGPLEILCTVEEETGLTGAAGLKGEWLSGRLLLNIDTEEEGALYVGCAGGGNQTGQFRIRREPADPDAQTVRIRVSGLKGGHSGLDIHLGRGNAIRVMAGLLGPLLATELCVSVDTITGGNKHNAIPREAEAIVRVLPARRGEFEKLVRAYTSEQASLLGMADPGLQIRTYDAAAGFETMPVFNTRRLLGLLLELPHGAVEMSPDIEGLVQTSNNLAVVGDDGVTVTVMTSSRSSVAEKIDALRDRICELYDRAGGRVERDDGYPGWEPDMDSDLLARCKAVYQGLYGREPEVKAVHAGLECGIIGEQVPGMDMISFGPTLGFPHSPDEFLDIPTTGKVWDFLRALAADLAG